MAFGGKSGSSTSLDEELLNIKLREEEEKSDIFFMENGHMICIWRFGNHARQGTHE